MMPEIKDTLDWQSSSILNPRPTAPSKLLLHELLTNNDPTSVALSFYQQLDHEPTELTYDDIDRLSNQVAQDLISEQISNQIVPVILPQCPELYISILGILKSGNAFCPILPSETTERIDFICQETNAPVIFRDESNRLFLNTIVSQKSVDPRLPVETHGRPDLAIRPDGLAYIMYTSGSTGTPKAVMITHSAATTSILAHDQIFNDHQTMDRFLQFANSTFDISVFEIFSAWSRGMTLVSAHRTILMTTLPELIERARINYMELTPSVAGLLPDQHDPRMRTVKVLITIGEMLTKRVIVNWHGKLFNAYGPTEATLHVSFSEVTAADFDPSDIGAPLDSCVLAIMDQHSTSLLPNGHIGELCIAGAQVSNGYLKRPDLTQASFISHTSFEGSVYRTGDLALVDNGHIYFRGRKEGDSQVKIHGQRIEIGEIEHHIQQHCQFHDCAVICQDQRFYAFVVLSQDQLDHELDVHTIKLKLPLDIRPKLIVLETMPMSSAGKRDIKQLRSKVLEQEKPAMDMSDASVDALSSLEAIVLEVIRTVLEDPVKLNQSLRDLGLDSLGAIKIVMSLRAQGLSVELFDVLRSKNALDLSRYCLPLTVVNPDLSHQADTLTGDTIRRLRDRYGEDRDFAACSEIQVSMVGATISNLSERLYCNHIWLELEKAYTAQNFSSAWDALVASNEILRTGFHMDTDEVTDTTDFIQIIHPVTYGSSVQCEQTDNILATLENHKRTNLMSPDDFQKPPLDVRFYETPCSEKNIISIVIHHALYDAWSLELILHDLCKLLKKDSKEHVTIAPRPSYRASLSALQRRTPTNTDAKQYWTKYLQHWQTPRFPMLAQTIQSTNDKSRFSRTCEFDWTWFESKCRALGHNAQTLGQLTWAVLLACITGESAPAMALTTSGRTFAVDGLAETAGPFITTFPFYLSRSENSSIRDALEDVNKYNQELTKHQHSYRDILRCSTQRQSPDTLFIYQKSGTKLGLEDFLTIVKQEDRLEFALVLTFEHGPVSLDIHIDVLESLVHREAAEMLLAQMEHVLLTIMSDTSKPLNSLRRLPDKLSSCMNVNPILPNQGRLNSIFDNLSCSLRERPALEFFDSMNASQILSYGQLNACANKLANALANESLLPDDIVAVCMDKCISMYASILAILKLGCGYVALDPQLPQERLDATLQITKARHVFTNEGNAHKFAGLNVVFAPSLLKSSNMTTFASRPSSGLAYVLMTSGTTGLPKACAVTHSNVLSNCEALSRIYPHSPEDRMMQFTSYTFDVSVFELFFTWYNGMCLVAASKDLLLSNLTMALQKFHITHLNMTPTAAALVESSELPEIKCFITSGEASNKRIIHDWGSSKRYFNAYGPTETTNVCSARLVDSPLIHPSALGFLLPNSSGFVLDHIMNVLPRFSLGELFVGGAQVIRGYLGNKDLTDTSFVEHPELGRIYRTGDVSIDLVRVLEDGSFSIAGRADTQVKVRGFRVELSEIDHLLRANKSVIDSATIQHENSLVSFIYNPSMTTKEMTPIVEKLYDEMRTKLPEYMLPAFIIPLEEPIPLTVSYKLDTRVLIDQFARHKEHSTPVGKAFASEALEWSEESHFVAKLLSELSRVPLKQILPDTSLYKLGLDSISAIRISASLKKHYNNEISVSKVLQLGTPARIASILGARSFDQGSASRESTREDVLDGKSFTSALQIIESIRDDILVDVNLTTDHVEAILPCTPLQEGIVLESHKGNNASYTNLSVVRLQQGISSDRLRSACESLLQLTPSFRTQFAFTAHKSLPCVQVILKQSNIDWSTKQSTDVDGTIESWSQSTKFAPMLHSSPVRFLEIFNSEVHFLVLAVHHSVFDGWSLNLIYQDLDLLCQGLEVLRRSPVIDAIRSAYEGSAETQTQKDDWKAYLDSFQPQSLPLLTTSSEDSQSTILIDLKTSLSDIEHFASTNLQSVLTLLQTSWALCLSQITNSQDVCFASVVSGRTIAVDSIENIAIPLFNVLPMRVNFEDGSTVESAMNKVKQSNLRHLAHPHYPLSKAIRTAKLEPDELLFDTILILQRPEETDAYKSFVHITDNGTSEYALMLEFIPRPSSDTMVLRVVANNNHVSAANLKLIATQVDHFLQHAFESDQTAAEVLASSSHTYSALSNSLRDPAPTELLHSAFDKHVRDQPEALAIQYLNEAGETHQMTYDELNSKAYAIVNTLHSQRLKRSTPILVMMSRVPEIFYTFLGVLKAGMVYTPVAVETPAERLAAILSDLKPGQILVDDSVDTSKIYHEEIPIINVASLENAAHADNQCEQASGCLPADLAYIIYTSGSTGGPKAVMLSHEAAVATIHGSKPLLDLNKSSKWLQFASLTFDMSVFDMAIAFSSGICLCGAPKAMLLDDLSGVIQKLQVTHLDLTPSVARTLRRKDLPLVKLLFCIGEALTKDIILEWGEKCINVYGPTEAAMACTSVLTTPKSIPQDIGQPFKHVQAGIFSLSESRLLAKLAIGELCIAGPQLALGYLNDIEKTQASFFTYNNTKFYRTGDLSRMLADGSIAFLGRKDFQIKLRGQRIELGEIDQALLAIGENIASATTSLLHLPRQTVGQLVSFISSTDKGSINGEACQATENADQTVKLTDHLTKALPTYMIPSLILNLNYIPLTSARKVDRKLLEKLWLRYAADVPTTDHGSHEEGMTDTEKRVRAIFSDMSGTLEQDIGRDTSMYSLGLDSISAMQLVSILHKSGTMLSVVDVLKNSSVRRLAQTIDEKLPEQTPEAQEAAENPEFVQLCNSLRAQAKSECDCFPCTPVQENMIAQFIKSGGEAYYNHRLFKVAQRVDSDRLKKSWIQIINDNAFLRASFVAMDRQDCQYAMEIHTDSLVESIWSHVEAADLNTTVSDLVKKLGIELLRDIRRPSLRIHVLEGPNDKFLLFSAHHAIYDGYTLEQLFEQVENVYLNKQYTPLGDLEQSVSRLWSIYHNKSQQSKSEAYWKDVINSSSYTPFPNLNNTTSKEKTNSSELRALTDLQQLDSECKRRGVSLSNVVVAAWSKLLSSYTGEASVTFGVVLSGRTGTGLNNASCPCITTVPYTCTLAGSVESVMHHFNQMSSEALLHQHAALNRISRDDSSPLFDTILVYQKRANARNSEKLLYYQRDIASVEVPISLEVTADADTNECYLELVYQEAVLPVEHSKVLLAQFEEILRAMLANADAEILDLEDRLSSDLLSILPPAVPILDVPVSLVHQHVEYFAGRTPNAIALEFATDLESPSNIWTYLQVEERSNQLANYLMQHHGLTTSAPVAVCLDKSPEAFIGILAVLKTGSPFCCLDSSSPIERRKFIITDSGADAVICSSEYKAELASAVDVKVLTIPDLENLESSRDTPSITIDDSALCYILYTSGSTGTPKGCCLSHKSVIQALASFQTEFVGRFDAESKFLAFASMHFDVSVLETYFSWSIGARVCAAPKDALLSDIPGAIKKFGITHLDLTPQLAMSLLPEDAESLRVFITGGEMLRKETVDHWGDSGTLFNFYGPTEATIGCTALKQVRKNSRPSNIGQQWSNCGTIVASPLGSHKPALKGAVGELIVTGLQVADGYMGLPEATGKKFKFNKLLNARSYDTGDLVRLLAVDNSFDFVGRADSQVKLRGQRIETGEIDSVLVTSGNGIRDAFTLVLKHPSQQNDHLVSFVVPRSHYESGSSKMLTNNQAMASQFEACRSRLPVYMVPTYVIPISRLGLTATNKVDTKSLQSMFFNLESAQLPTYSQHKTRKPTASADRSLVNSIKCVLSEMTGVELESIADNASVFSLGLDSVSVVGLVRKLRETGVLGVSVTTVMTSGDVVDLALAMSDNKVNSSKEPEVAYEEVLDKHRKKNIQAAAEQLSIDCDCIEDILPCTPLVEGLLVESIQQGNKTHFNSFKILGATIDRKRLLQAFEELIIRTKVLRTRFILLPGGLTQVIVSATSQTPTNLEEFPLKSSLVQLNISDDNGDTLYEFTIHHALYDGQSLDLMLRDLNFLYRGAHDVVAQSPPDFRQAVAYILSHKIDAARKFWQQELKHSVTLTPIRKSSRVHSASIKASVDSSSLEACARQYKCSPNIIIQAVWTIVAGQLLGGDSCFGIVVAGRNAPLEEIESMIYPMFNTLPVFIEASTIQDVRVLISNLQHSFGKAIQHEHTPLRDIKKLLSVKPAEALFDTLLVYQRGDIQREAKESKLQLDGTSQDPAGFSVALDVTAFEQGPVELTINMCDLGSDATVLLECFSQVLARLVENLPLPDLRDLITHLTPVQVARRSTSISQNNDIPQVHTSRSIEETPDLHNFRKVLSDMLKTTIDDILVDDTFFTMGLDSIDVVKLSARLKQLYGYRFSVADIMQNCSLRALQSLLRDRADRASDHKAFKIPKDFAAKAAEVLNIKQDSVQTILPVSPMQAGMLTSAAIREDDLYMNHVLLQLKDDLDLSLLQKAWLTVISTNDILRTSFAKVDPERLAVKCEYVQVVHHMAHFTIETTGGSSDDLMALYQTHKIEATQLFKAGKVPFKLGVIKAEHNRYLALSIHHALYDGVSLDLIFHDVKTFCLTKQQTAHPSYVMLLEHILGVQTTRSDLFWSTYLKKCSPKLIFEGDTTASSKYIMKSKVALKEAQEASKSLGVSLQALTQAVFSKMVMEASHQTDIVFGTIQGGRSFSPEAQHIIGPCMNTVPIRAQIKHDTSLQSLAHDLHIGNIDMIEHIHTPLKRIQNIVGKGPLFETMFVYQTSGEDSERAPIWTVVEEDSSVEFPLAVECQVTSSAILWTVAMYEGYLGRIEDVATRLDDILNELVANPQARVFSGEQTIFKDSSDARAEDASDDLEAFDPHNEVTLDRITDIVAQAAKLNRADVRQRTSLFALGMDSIRAIELARTLKRSGLKISVGEILRNATVQDMRRVILLNRKAASTHTADGTSTQTSTVSSYKVSLDDENHVLSKLRLERSELKYFAPASAAQAYFVSAWCDLSGGRFMSNFAFVVSDSQDAREGLISRWSDLLSSQDILRTTFCSSEEGSRLFQCVLKTWQAEIIEFTSCTKSLDMAITDYLESDKFPCPDLTRPPISMALVKSNAAHEAVVLSIHHALYDATSLPVLIDYLRGTDIEQVLPYREYSSRMLNEAPNASCFWKSYLKGAQPCWLRELNSVSPAHPDMSPGFSDTFYTEKEMETSVLDHASTKLGVTSQALILSAIAKIINEVWQLENLILGMYSSGRSLPVEGIETVFGPTVNILPVRFDDLSSTRLVDVVRKTHTSLIEMNGFMQQCSVDDIVQALDWKTVSGGLVDISVNILPRHTQVISDTNPVADTILTAMDRLQPDQIEIIRSKYASVQRVSVEGYKGLRSLKPVIDIEVEIQHDSVKMGVFCNRPVLSSTQAQKFMRDIWHEIATL